MLLENPWKYDFRDSKFQNVLTCLQELVPLVRVPKPPTIHYQAKLFDSPVAYITDVLSNLLPVSNICGAVLNLCSGPLWTL